jgi:diguanylate cyclase (GGDEF)-like protein
LGRLGGDEFVSLAIEMNDYRADTMLDRITMQMDEFNAARCRKYPLSISFGVAYYDPKLPCDLDELLDEADRAMYEQKQAKEQLHPRTIPV